MKKPHFNDQQINNAKLLDTASFFYKNYFLSENRYTEQFKDGYKALLCFLRHYAYQRQGSPAAYARIGISSISKIYNNGNDWNIPTKDDAEQVWKEYKQIAMDDFNLFDRKKGKVKVNKALNPLNEDKGIISRLASSNNSNIAIYIRNLMINSDTVQAHRFMKSIRGIGEKISSFYLRDIAYLANLDENNISHLYLLQPIDTWLNQTLEILFKQNVPNNLQKKQKLIVELCKESGVSSVSFNQGAWVLGSQIAGDFEKFEKSLSHHNSTESVVEKYINQEERKLCEMHKVLDRLRRMVNSDG